MKKLLTVLVLSSVAEMAAAQTNVTIYGVVDMGLDRQAGGVAGNVVKMSSGIGSGSRLGFKGTEDLGGGLSADFVLESGFNVDTGTSGQGGVMFGRQAWVGLSGAFGSVSAGRQLSSYHKGLRDVADPFCDGFAGQAMNIITGNSRVDNSVIYGTPTVAGWSAEVTYGAGEVPGNDATTRSRKRVLSGALSYAPGPFAVVLAHHRREDAVLPDHVRNSLLAARYTVGAVTAHAAFVRTHGLD